MAKAKTKSKSPTQRTLAMLRKMGYQVATVERWNPHCKIRQDLFGCIDIIAVGEDIRGVWGFQVTTSDNLSKRRGKAMAEVRLQAWLASGNRFFLHGWVKRAKTKLWDCREEEVLLSDLVEPEATDAID